MSVLEVIYLVLSADTSPFVCVLWFLTERQWGTGDSDTVGCSHQVVALNCLFRMEQELCASLCLFLKNGNKNF